MKGKRFDIRMWHHQLKHNLEGRSHLLLREGLTTIRCKQWNAASLGSTTYNDLVLLTKAWKIHGSLSYIVVHILIELASNSAMMIGVW